MENQQTSKRKSVDSYKNHPGSEHFDIQIDQGTLYTPGQVSVHDYSEVLYCQTNSGAECMVEGEKILLQRGDMLLISPNKVHGFVSYGQTEEGYMGYSVRVSREFAGSLAKNAKELIVENGAYMHVRTRGTLWDRIDQLFLMVLEEIRAMAPGWENALFGYALVLLTQIGRAAVVDPSEGLKAEKSELLNSILSYVEANLGEKITLEETANKFFVSASTITNLFSKKMNVSFYKYVMQRRLWMAKNLIREGMAMEKIAIRVGFGDYSAFYRAFKQEFGMSPRQFAKDSVKE